jgi:hypothetical protein
LTRAVYTFDGRSPSTAHIVSVPSYTSYIQNMIYSKEMLLFHFYFTRKSDANVPSSNSRIKPCIAPISRIDHASVPEMVPDCSS